MICARLSLSQQPEVTEDVAGQRVYCLPYNGNIVSLPGLAPPAGTWSLHNLDDNKSQQGLIGATASCTVQPFDGFKTIRPLEGRRGDVKGFWQEPNQVLTVDWEC